MSEESLIETRKAKHAEFNSGKYPLANPNYSHVIFSTINYIEYLRTKDTVKTTIDLLEVNEEPTFSLRGRLVAIRKSGALTFIKLTDSTGSIQLVATRNNLSDYERLKLLDLGDIIEVSGKPVLTKTGEKSILLSSWYILTKSHRPPPEKFAGLSDIEIKYRERYVDLMSSEETRFLFLTRTQIIKSIRSWMESTDFIEVETPMLNSINSGANAKPFTTHHNSLDMEMYLRIAPELYLKRLLVGGFDKVFEIGKSFRNEGLSTRHNPEFTMLEFYEAYGSLDNLISYTQDFIQKIDRNVFRNLQSINKSAYNFYSERALSRSFSLSEFKSVKMVDAVLNGLSRAALVINDNFSDLYNYGNINNERLSKINTHALIKELNNSSSKGQRIGILFEFIVEPFLTEDYRTEDQSLSCPVFVTDYPVELCPLARPQDNNPKICDRFELYVDGRELCNAYQELNDPDMQAIRFTEQLKSNNKDPMDYDADYVKALQYGMPPAVGFGMGIDRLVMLLTGATSIKDVILFPTMKPTT